MMLDSHVHLQDIPDAGAVGEILAAAPGRGIGLFFCNATSPADWDRVAGIAAGTPAVVPFFGIHPWYTDRSEPGWEARLESLLNTTPSGVGETGLDKGNKGGDFAKQEEYLKLHLEAAERLAKPLVLHCVKAWPELTEILRARKPGGIRILLHSFGGSGELLKDLAGMGAFFSFSRRQFERQAEKTASLVRRTPPDRLLLETDYPYTGDEPGAVSHAGKYFDCLCGTYAAAALALGADVKQLEETVWRNGKVFLHGAPDR